MSGPVPLVNHSWLVKPWILENNLLLPLSQASIIPNYILNTHPYTQR